MNVRVYVRIFARACTGVYKCVFFWVGVLQCGSHVCGLHTFFLAAHTFLDMFTAPHAAEGTTGIVEGDACVRACVCGRVCVSSYHTRTQHLHACMCPCTHSRIHTSAFTYATV
jgi:hypothetical protein